MGIFQKLSTVLKSNINDLIARAENPEKMLNQIILDMRDQLAKAKREVAAALRLIFPNGRSVIADISEVTTGHSGAFRRCGQNEHAAWPSSDVTRRPAGRSAATAPSGVGNHQQRWRALERCRQGLSQRGRIEGSETPRRTAGEAVGIEIVTRRKRDHPPLRAIERNPAPQVEKVARNLPTAIDIRLEIVQVSEAERRPILGALRLRGKTEGGKKGGENGSRSKFHEIVDKAWAKRRSHSHTT